MAKLWYLYILRCADNTLYTGITTDLAARIETHRKGCGAKYLKPRKRRPFKMVFNCEVSARSEALKLERHIKSLPKADKERLVEKFPTKAES